MKWSDAFATGIQQIDDQHKMIFRMAEDYRAALDEGNGEGVYGNLLESLDLYVRTHFGYEEACMARFVCPAAKVNAEAHAKFVEALSRFKETYAGKGFDPTEARNLVDTIDLWLVNHIGRVDSQLKPYA